LLAKEAGARREDSTSGTAERRAHSILRPATRGGGEAGLRPARADAGQEARVIYEVFRQERKGQPFQHAGSLDAPDRAFAETYAKEFYGRRGESEALWVVPRESILEIEEFVDELNRNYHRVDGYSLKEKLKEARERAGTAAAAGDR
jgi:phenylacetate-CoA oxygenase PaaH subunit